MFWYSVHTCVLSSAKRAVELPNPASSADPRAAKAAGAALPAAATSTTSDLLGLAVGQEQQQSLGSPQKFAK
jgi:hypothetical protein